MEGGYSDVVVDEMADDDDSHGGTPNREDSNDQEHSQQSSDYESEEEFEVLVHTCATAPEDYRPGTPIPGVDEEARDTPQRADDEKDGSISATPPTSTPSTPTLTAEKNSVRPTFKNILQAKKRLQAFSSVKAQLKKEDTRFEVKDEEEAVPDIVECKEEKVTTPKKLKKDKEMDPNERAKAVIEEIEAIKREEAKQRVPSKGPDREEFRRRDLKGRRFRRKSQTSPIPQSSSYKSPPREYRKFDRDSRDRSSIPRSKTTYTTAKSWKEYKRLPDHEQTGTDCKFDPQIYRALNQNCFLKRLLSVETPNMMLKSLMVNRQSKKESYFVPFQQVRNTKTVPHICWSVNPEFSLSLTRKEVFDYVSSQRRELIEKLYNQERKKYPMVKRLTNRSWFPKHWSKIDRSDFAVVQTYSDDDVEFSDRETHEYESNKNVSNRDRSFHEDRNKVSSDKIREEKKKGRDIDHENKSAGLEKEKEIAKKSRKSRSSVEKKDSSSERNRSQDTKSKKDKKSKDLEDKKESHKSKESKDESKLDVSGIPLPDSESFKFYQSIKELEEELERRKRILQLQHSTQEIQVQTTSSEKEKNVKSKSHKVKKSKDKRKKKHSSTSTSTSSSSSESSEADEKSRKKRRKMSESKNAGSTDRSSRSKSTERKIDKTKTDKEDKVKEAKVKKIKNRQSGNKKKKNEKLKKLSKRMREKKKSKKSDQKKKGTKNEDEKSPDTDEYHSHWESEDDAPPLVPDKNTSWESEEEVFNQQVTNVLGSTPKTEYESKDFEIPLNIKFPPRTDDKASEGGLKEKSVDADSELLKMENVGEMLAEQRMLEMEKLLVRDLQKGKVLMSEKELRKRKKRIKKKLLSTIDWMDADSLALAKASIKKEILDNDLDSSFMEKNEFEKSAILENEYKEFMKSVTSGSSSRKDRKKKKKRKGRSSSTSSSSSNSSSGNSVKHARKRKKKKSNVSHSSPKMPNLIMSKMVITSLDDLLPACLPSIGDDDKLKEIDKEMVESNEPPKSDPSSLKEESEKIENLVQKEAVTTITEAPSLESIPLPIPTPVPPPKIDMSINPLITSTLGLDFSLPNLDPKLPIIEPKLSIPEIKLPVPDPKVLISESKLPEPDPKLLITEPVLPKIDEQNNLDHLPSIDDVLLEDKPVTQKVVSNIQPSDVHLAENVDESLTNETVTEPIIFTSMVLPVKKTLLDNSALKLNDSDSEEKTDDKIKKSSEEKIEKDLNTSKEIKKESSKRERSESKRNEESKKRDEDRQHHEPRRSDESRKNEDSRESRKSEDSKKHEDAKRRTDTKKSDDSKRGNDDSRRSASRDSKRDKSRRSPVSSRRKRSPIRRRSSPKSRRNQSPADKRRRSISPKRSRRSPQRYRGRRSISPRRRSKRSLSPPSPTARGPRSPPPIKRHRSRSPRRDKSPEMKKSLPDSTISDDLLPLQSNGEIDRYKTESPKRPSLDERINQVLGISNSEEYEQQTPPTNMAAGGYYQQSQAYPPYPNYQSNYATPPNKNAVQMGNMLQIVPTEDFSTQLETKLSTSTSVIDAAANTSQKIVQFGNMLQIVPAQIIEGTMADVGKTVQVITPNDNLTSAETLMQQKINERKAEREKRRQERERRRKEKEKRRKEREIKRQLKVKMKTESLIKKMAFDMDEENGFVNEEIEDEESDWPLLFDPLQIISTPIKEGLKSILAKGGYNKTESKPEEVTKKSVLFADGIRPGEGTSTSGGEELSSPPPIAPKEKRYKKVKVPRKAKKKKIRVKVVKKQLAEDESDEEDNLPPPPPPPGSPPPHLFPPRIKTHTINNIHPTFLHNNMVPPPPVPVPVPPPNPNNYQQYVQPPPPPTRMMHHNRNGPPPPPIPMPATQLIHYQQSPNLH